RPAPIAPTRSPPWPRRSGPRATSSATARRPRRTTRCWPIRPSRRSAPASTPCAAVRPTILTARSPEPAGRALSPHDLVAAGLCIGCGACVAGSRGVARMRFDAYGRLRPDGPDAWLKARTEAFARICPFSPYAPDEDELAAASFPEASLADGRIGRYAAAYVGAAQEAGYREAGSSGGLTTWTAAALLRGGLVDAVAHVAPTGPPAGDERLFRYRISRSLGELQAGAKSRYYPIELSAVLDEIHATPGRYAVVGVPCFIKAVRLQCAADPVL